MTIHGAVIIEQRVTFASSSGAPHYYGRKDIVDFLKTVRLDQIPWKEYHIY